MDIINTQQRDVSVAAYYNRLKGLWEEQSSYLQIPICTYEATKSWAAEREKERVHQFLMRLHDKFNVVRSQILNTDPLPTLARAYGLVSQEERQQQVSVVKRNNPVEGATFTTAKSTNRLAGSRNMARNHDVSKLFCEHCKRARHTKETCFEIHGYPNWWDKNRKGKGRSANNSKVGEERPSNEEADWNG
ncbi:hypothetical protein P3X46_026501 [Hevea brasiliensis]|uniref:Retrotransposon gag domain-containing protein n=1 Tax=Hevea brasiliensis TaxID=3981 RepID=A0ABQ9L098_HEVBR|nr:hypothetical protein P3X46_026501 [Hevea brasiliensis]